KFCSKHMDDPSCTTLPMGDATLADSALCYGGGLPVCLLAAPTGPYNVSTNLTLSTSVDGNCDRIVAQAGTAPELCIHAATTIGTGGTAGTAVTPPSPLRGGCRGGRGGAGLLGGTRTPGGDGGGAIYFVAGGTIMISGTIDASGRGGGAGAIGNGGAGGGGGG